MRREGEREHRGAVQARDRQEVEHGEGEVREREHVQEPQDLDRRPEAHRDAGHDPEREVHRRSGDRDEDDVPRLMPEVVAVDRRGLRVGDRQGEHLHRPHDEEEAGKEPAAERIEPGPGVQRDPSPQTRRGVV